MPDSDEPLDLFDPEVIQVGLDRGVRFYAPDFPGFTDMPLKTMPEVFETLVLCRGRLRAILPTPVQQIVVQLVVDTSELDQELGNGT